MTKTHYTTAEVAALEGISVRRVVAKIKQGHYPSAKKYGRDWLIEAADLHKQPPH